MSIFVDTSAIITYLDAADPDHALARRTWDDLLARKEDLVSTSYAVVEAFAVVQRRFGLDRVAVLDQEIHPVLSIQWVDEAIHNAGVAALLAAGRRPLSLVDCVSFETMRRRGIQQVFCFDPHFGEAGFHVLP